MIDPTLARRASLADRKLLRRIHPLGLPILNAVAKRGPLLRIPRVGVVVSEAALIREVLLDRQRFSKQGEGAGGSFWTPILGRQALINMDGEEHRLLKRELAGAFSNAICPAVVQRVMASEGVAFQNQLLSGEPVDIAQIVDRFAYRTIWELLGLPEAEIFEPTVLDEKVRELKSIIEGITVTRTTLPKRQIRIANTKLTHIEQLARDMYRATQDSSTVPGLMKERGFDEDAAVSIVKVMMIAGTETIVGFLPRMTALFIDSGYMHHLRAEPEHLSAGVNAALRHAMPTAVDARTASGTTEFHGLQLVKGERLILSLIHAGLRYGHFDPFQPLDRDIRGLWFGAGVHMCIGLPLALAQAEAFGAALIEAARHGELEIRSRKATRHGHLGGYERLEVQCVAS